MKNQPKIRICALLGLLSLCSVAAVQAEEGSSLRLDVYGTLGFTHDNASNLAPVRDLSQRPKSGGYTNNSLLTDSRLGVQASYLFNSFVDVMAQAVWRDKADKSANSYLDWAYVNLHPVPVLDVRLGRVGYDVFLMSDHRHLGYAYPWVRPPIEFYGWIPVYAIDGCDVTYTLEDGTDRWRFKAQAGGAGLKFPMGSSSSTDYPFKSDLVWGLTAAWESDPWRVKGGYSEIAIATDAPIIAPLQAGLFQVAGLGIAPPAVRAEAADMLSELTYKDVTLRYTTLGVAYDDGTWLGQVELGRVTTTADMVSNGNMAYAGVGRRFGDWTPFVMLSGVRSNAPLRRASANWASLGASAQRLQATAVTVLNTTRFSQDTGTLGLRWDFNSHAAIKMQLDSTSIHSNGYGLWYYNGRGLTVQNARVNLLSTTLDFVF